LAAGTGGSAGPYVHYEIHFYGIPVDPQQYMLPTLE
jgi:murein DD-endopeptidase MepM/ murein hydrolase activator NlpD